jgi:hypothetical protein
LGSQQVVRGGEEIGSQAPFHGSESDLLHPCDHLGDASPQIGEDEAAKDGGPIQGKVEGDLADGQGPNR